MGVGDIASIAIGLISTAFTTAKNLGIIGNPDWVKYAEAGLFIAASATDIIKGAQLNPSKYDTMTPAEITTLLTPSTWDDLEAKAAQLIKDVG